MHPNEALVREFYAAFARRDAEAMAKCYHPEVFFSDPVFPKLHGAHAADMWRMLLARAADLEVSLDEASADADGGTARWTARYTFSRTGRPVVNRVRGMFAFRDGLIARHYDHFSFWRWAAQALGPAGSALGWFAPLKWKVRRDAAKSLDSFRERHQIPGNSMTRILCALLAVAVLALAAPVTAQPPARPPPADPELLRALDREIWLPFVEAFAAGKPEDYIALHSRSLIRATGGARRIEPYDQWVAGVRGMFKRFADRGTQSSIRFRFTERIANTDTASERGVFEFTLLPAKGEPRRSYGRFHVLSRKEDGRWKIVADYDSDEGGTVNAQSFEAAHAPDDYARY